MPSPKWVAIVTVVKETSLRHHYHYHYQERDQEDHQEQTSVQSGRDGRLCDT
jgi:hypothetical protein